MDSDDISASMGTSQLVRKMLSSVLVRRTDSLTDEVEFKMLASGTKIF
jgi:hypothetical protein